MLPIRHPGKSLILPQQIVDEEGDLLLLSLLQAFDWNAFCKMTRSFEKHVERKVNLTLLHAGTTR